MTQIPSPGRTRMLAGLTVVSLAQLAGCPLVEETIIPGVVVETSLGEFVIELDTANAPLTVANFLQYVDEGFYEDTIFHRIEAGSLVQGGGYTLTGLVQKATRDPIPSESDNGLLNVRASVAMARTDDPNSATAQFYVNLVDNADLDQTDDEPGYTVFGEVIEGMDFIDAIAAVSTGQRGGMSDVPEDDIFIDDVQRTEIAVGDATVPGVRIVTSLGEFVIQLDPEQAPLTVENFLQYVDDGFYVDTVFHRVIADFVVQGGGFELGLAEKTTRPPVPNESANGISNIRATVAMAWENDPNSAAAQFYVNTSDNLERDATGDALGNAVFGRVVDGMDVIDAIAALPTESRDGLSDVPTEDVIIMNIEITEFPGGLQLTPEGEEYVETRTYRVQTLLRDLLVDLLGLGLYGLLG